VDRREFLAATAVAAVSPLPRLDALAPQAAPRQFIELRRYHLLPGGKPRAFNTFIGDVAIPAMNRAGVGRVGAFTVVYGENAPVAVARAHAPHARVRGDYCASASRPTRHSRARVPRARRAAVRPGLRSRREHAAARLRRDAGAGAIGGCRYQHPAHLRAPDLREPQRSRRAQQARDVQCRRDPDLPPHWTLTPVFFGETVVGAKMPSLTYMLTFKGHGGARRGLGGVQPGSRLEKLSGDPQYKENVSAISDIILRPTSVLADLTRRGAQRVGEVVVRIHGGSPATEWQYTPADARSPPELPRTARRSAYREDVRSWSHIAST